MTRFSMTQASWFSAEAIATSAKACASAMLPSLYRPSAALIASAGTSSAMRPSFAVPALRDPPIIGRS